MFNDKSLSNRYVTYMGAGKAQGVVSIDVNVHPGAQALYLVLESESRAAVCSLGLTTPEQS